MSDKPTQATPTKNPNPIFRGSPNKSVTTPSPRPVGPRPKQ